MKRKNLVSCLYVVIALVLSCRGSEANADGGMVAVVADADGTTFFLDNLGFVWGFKNPDQIAGLEKLSNLSHIQQIVPFAALRDDGHVMMWDLGPQTICKNDEGGPLGRNVTYSIPTEVKGLDDVIAISGIDRHFLALRRDGSVVAFGRKLIGPYGSLEPTECAPIPKSDLVSIIQPISKLKNVVSVSAGIVSDSVLTSDGEVYTWGRVALTKDWQSDLTREILSSDPKEIFVGKDQSDISAIGNHLFTLTRAGSVRVWGVCLDGSPNQGDVLSGFQESFSGVRKIVVNPASDLFPNAYILRDGRLMMSYAPDVTGPIGLCGHVGSPPPPFPAEYVPGLSIKVQDAALLDGSDLANDWILMIGTDGSIWKILRGQISGFSNLSKMPVP